MKRINISIMAFLVLIFGSGCSVLKPLMYSPEELTAMQQEENRITECAAKMKIFDVAKDLKPYELVQIISHTDRNGSEENAFHHLRRQACEKKGDALLIMDMQMGPRNTTFTAKIINWMEPSQ